MDRLKALTALAEKVEAGTERDVDFGAVWPASDPVTWQINRWAYIACSGGMIALGSAQALHEAVLPGWGYRIGPQYALVLDPNPLYGAPRNDRDSSLPIPARAWLLAILRALIAQEQQ